MLRGVDVSKWQNPDAVNWTKVAQSQDFAIARACYGTRPDRAFVQHVTGARGAGMQVGGYLFFRQVQGAEEQIEEFISALTAARIGPGDIAPVIDLEWNEQYDGPVQPHTYSERGRRIAEVMRKEYGECMLYLAPGFFQTLGEPSWMLEYPWWIAHYTDDPEPWCPWKNWDIWQYTGTGRIDGYATNIDLNVAKRLPKTMGEQGDVAELRAEIARVSKDVDRLRRVMAKHFGELADGLGAEDNGET